VPNVGTMDMDLDVSEFSPRHLLDGALATPHRSDELDTVKAGRHAPAGWALVVGAVVRDIRRFRARHEMFTWRLLSVHARSLSTRRCTYFEPGGCS
jgi:hypothetical protein